MSDAPLGVMRYRTQAVEPKLFQQLKRNLSELAPPSAQPEHCLRTHPSRREPGKVHIEVDVVDPLLSRQVFYLIRSAAGELRTSYFPPDCNEHELAEQLYNYLLTKPSLPRHMRRVVQQPDLLPQLAASQLFWHNGHREHEHHRNDWWVAS